GLLRLLLLFLLRLLFLCAFGGLLLLPLRLPAGLLLRLLRLLFARRGRFLRRGGLRFLLRDVRQEALPQVLDLAFRIEPEFLGHRDEARLLRLPNLVRRRERDRRFLRGLRNGLLRLLFRLRLVLVRHDQASPAFLVLYMPLWQMRRS